MRDGTSAETLVPRLDDLTDEIRCLLSELRVTVRGNDGLPALDSSAGPEGHSPVRDGLSPENFGHRGIQSSLQPPAPSLDSTGNGQEPDGNQSSGSDYPTRPSLSRFSMSEAGPEVLEINCTVMTNLQNCAVSAGRAVSSASTFLTTSTHYEGSTCGSIFGDILVQDRRELVETWLPDTETQLVTSEPTDSMSKNRYSMVDDPGVSGDDTDSDVESNVVRSLHRTALERFEASDYTEAAGCLLKSLDYLEKKHGAQFDGRNEMVDMLVISYRNQSQWDDAERTLLHYIYSLPEQDAEALRSHHVLAEVYVEKQAYKDAETHCQIAVKGRKKALGRKHPLFLESVDLLVDIYECLGDLVAAKGYRTTYLPSGVMNSGRARKRAIRKLQECGYRIEGMDPSTKSHALRWAATDGLENVVRVLIDSEGGIREIVDSKDRIGKCALHLASLNGHETVASLLLENGANVEAMAACAMTSLHLAAYYGHELVVRCLLDNGAVVNRPTDSGETPLQLAAKEGHLRVIRLLVTRGANIETADVKGRTALHIATIKGTAAVVRLLLENRADITARDNEEATPLHWAAWCGHREIVQALLGRDADVSAKAIAGGTPLRGASLKGHFEVVVMLLNAGADINTKNRFGRTALKEAEIRGHHRIVQLLRAKGAS